VSDDTLVELEATGTLTEVPVFSCWYVCDGEEAMKEPKQIAYFYNTVLADEETEFDLDGTVSVPVKGDTRQHDGKMWRVEHVEIFRSGHATLPIYSVFLREGTERNFANRLRSKLRSYRR
jgi:hypothetical protein